MTWFSLGLGLAQLIAPGALARLIGVRANDDSRTMIRLVGLREVASGIGLLAGFNPAVLFGGRVAGDIMDLTLLGSSFGGRRVKQGRLAAATAMVAGVTALDLLGILKSGQRTDTRHSPTTSDRMTLTTKTIVVNCSTEDAYQFWLNFENFPRFMRHLERVSVRKDGRSHWVARGPGGQHYEWDAEIVENRPDDLITWRSLPGADVENEGSVRFERAPGGRGTLVRVNLRYNPPAGVVGSMVATLLGSEPGQEVQEDLRRFKQVIETGEVVLSDATVHGRPHPAQPPEGTFRLPTPVPGAGIARSATGTEGEATSDWPDPDGRPAHRAAADDAATAPTRGGAR